MPSQKKTPHPFLPKKTNKIPSTPSYRTWRPEPWKVPVCGWSVLHVLGQGPRVALLAAVFGAFWRFFRTVEGGFHVKHTICRDLCVWRCFEEMRRWGKSSGPSATFKGRYVTSHFAPENPNWKRERSNYIKFQPGGNVQVRKSSFQAGWFLE